MQLIQTVIDFYNAHSAVILGSLLAVSEGLALIPALKSNSILQMVINALKKKSEDQPKA